MKAFKIGTDGITEVEIDVGGMMADQITWDTIELDPGHDLLVDDDGLRRPALTTAKVGSRPHLPLPVFVVGVQGERNVDATITLAEITQLVSEVTVHRIDGKPMLGMDMKIDARGVVQPWRAVLAFKNEMTKSHEFLMRLPDDTKYMTPPGDVAHGAFTQLPHTVEDQAIAIAELLRSRGKDSVLTNDWPVENTLLAALARHGITFEQLKVAFPDHNYLDNPWGIGGAAAHEIANLDDEEGRQHGLDMQRRRRGVDERKLATCH